MPSDPRPQDPRTPRPTATMLTLAAAFAVMLGLAAGLATAEPDYEPEPPPKTDYYAKGLKMTEAGKHAEALALYRKAERADRRSPDTMNMIAYSSRKLGDLDTAFEYYEKALTLRPDFPQAREYLAEAHLQAALAQARWLKERGAKSELADVVDAFKLAADAAAEGRPANADDRRTDHGW